MPHDPYRALYLHLPFCVKRCAYCDFATAAVPADSPEIDAYVEDLCLQIRRKAKEGELGAVETVYLGGGTPSHEMCIRDRYKAAAKHGKSAVIDCAPLKRYELPKTVRSMAVGHGVTLTEGAAAKIVELVGEDTVHLDNEDVYKRQQEPS